jgi:superfamily II DNA/RNA helicase
MGHKVASLHGGMPQGRRNRVLTGLRLKQLKVLVATDVAARGIDVPSISHVINYGLPMKAEDYVHRIGRTGRAGRNGLAVTIAERMDAGMIRRIQQFTTQSIPVGTVSGLEPKSPEPKMFPPRAQADKFGARPVAPAKRFGKPFAQRRDQGFAPRRDEGFAPRRDDAFASRRDAGPFDRAPAKPGSRPAGKPGFKPQRPRPGGYGR